MTTEAPAKDTERYFEEIDVGETYTVEQIRTITETDVVNFAGVSGDFHPATMSEPYADEKFGGRIAHGHLVATVLESIIADMNPKSFTYGHDNVRFPNPTFIGDTLTGHREVVEKEPRNDELGKVVYRYEATDQDGNTVCVFDHLTMVDRRPDGETDR